MMLQKDHGPCVLQIYFIGMDDYGVYSFIFRRSWQVESDFEYAVRIQTMVQQYSSEEFQIHVVKGNLIILK